MAESDSKSFSVEEGALPVGRHALHAQWILPEGARREGPTLVFLHEGLGSIAQWRDFPLALARRTGLPALVYDRLGHGRAPALDGPRPLDYLEREALEVLPRVLEAAGITEPILIGHSDGGTIALRFAAAFPEVPKAVISEAHHVFLEPITMDGLARAAESFARGPLRARLERFHGPKVDAMFHGWNATWRDPGSRDWDMTRCLGTLQAPLLLIQGEDDEYGSREQMRIVAERVAGPVETWLIPGCGHVPHFQAREAVLERMAGFLGH